MYSASKAWGDTLRLFKDGKLAAKDENADIKNSLPIMNDINLPFANPPPPRDHILRSVNRFYSKGFQNWRGGDILRDFQQIQSNRFEGLLDHSCTVVKSTLSKLEHLIVLYVNTYATFS